MATLKRIGILLDMQDDYWLAIDVETELTDADWIVIEILDAALANLGYIPA